MQFQKFQALGNDFLIVKERDLPSSDVSLADLARHACDRHFGVGADGLELLLDAHPESPAADFAIRLFNADGGETPISGNGTRCVAGFLYFNNLWQSPVVRIATLAGTKLVTLKERDASRFLFETEMGTPRLGSHEVPVLLDTPAATVVRERLFAGSREIEFTASSMGNPHCSLLVEDFEALDWHSLGAALESHPAFPERTNVEFVRIVDRGQIEARFWERGVGPTLASGTGACAAAVAAMLNEKTDRRVKVMTEAGSLLVEWRADGTILQTGEVRAVFSGDGLFL